MRTAATTWAATAQAVSLYPANLLAACNQQKAQQLTSARGLWAKQEGINVTAAKGLQTLRGVVHQQIAAVWVAAARVLPLDWQLYVQLLMNSACLVLCLQLCTGELVAVVKLFVLLLQ